MSLAHGQSNYSNHFDRSAVLAFSPCLTFARTSDNSGSVTLAIGDMFTEGATMDPHTLWCGECLSDSPSTSKDLSGSNVAPPSTDSNRSSTRKRPFSALVENLKPTFKEGPDLKRRLQEEVNDLTTPFVVVDFDRAIQADSRVLSGLLAMERKVFAGVLSMLKVQRDDTLKARGKVVPILADICYKEEADKSVFPLAVQIMDRLLSIQSVPCRDLLSVGIASLLLASKMKACKPLTSQQLLYHHVKFNHSSVQKWEEVIVMRLEWNLSTPTALEFFDHLLARAPELNPLREDFFQCLECMQDVYQLAALLPSHQMAVVIFFLAEFHEVPLVRQRIYEDFRLDHIVIEQAHEVIRQNIQISFTPPSSSSSSPGAISTPGLRCH